MKRINIYTVKLVRESAKLYDIDREWLKITSPNSLTVAFNEIFDLQNQSKEHFALLCLDTKNKITGAHIVHVGALNASIVHPREVFQLAILNNAASIAVAHNHPSGDPNPSNEDIEVTKRLRESGNLLGIELLDHVIVGDNRYVSLREKMGW